MSLCSHVYECGSAREGLGGMQKMDTGTPYLTFNYHHHNQLHFHHCLLTKICETTAAVIIPNPVCIYVLAT